MQWRAGTVERELQRWSGAAVYAVRLDEGPEGAGEARPRGADTVKALAYTAMVGDLHPGDRVLLNASALLRGLGTGGLAFVVALPDRLPDDPRPGPGHIVKARYTPQQQMFMAVDEQDSPHHAVLAAADDLGGVPVVVADLHSALPAVIAGVRAEAPGARVVYLMTDGGALPAAFSRTVSTLRAEGWLAGTITVGQAYGGDHEAVTVHTGLLAAVHVLRADVVVVAQGPGNVGTGTTWGFSGVAAGEALNAAHVLGGRPIASLRVSEGDARPRHRGISHHSRTAYGRVALVPATLPVPDLDGEIGDLVRRQARELCDRAGGRLTAVDVPIDGLDEALRGAPVRLSTMGRGLDEDRAAFVAAAAAGRYAVRPAGTGPAQQ
jgi:hypothetical protein